MPRQNALKDSFKIYFAYRLGITENDTELFADVNSVMAYSSDKSGSSPDDRFGTDSNYTITLIIQDTEQTHYFDRYTKLWLYSTPKSSDDQANYRLVAEPIYRDKQIYLRCQSVAINNKFLFYLYGDKIVSFSVVYDTDNNKFYVPTNMYLPITKNTKLWYCEPDDKDSEEDTLTIIRKKEYSKFTEYTVERNYGEDS